MKAERPKVYLAAPLFNERERAFNELLAEKLGNHTDVFLPQRDGELLVRLVESGVPLCLAEQRVFDQDTKAMNRSDVLVAVLDGGYVDEGVAFEIGFVNGLGKICIGLQSDVRRALPTGNNPMISRGLHAIFNNVDDVMSWIRQYCQAADDLIPVAAE